MEQSEVDEEAELLGEVTGDVAVVKVDSGDGDYRVIVRSWSAEDAGVAADVRSDPISGDVVGIGEDGFFPGLESNVGVALAAIGEHQRRIDAHILPPVAELVDVVEELTAADELRLGVRESAMADEIELLGGGGEEEGRKREEYEKINGEEMGLLLHLTSQHVYKLNGSQIHPSP